MDTDQVVFLGLSSLPRTFVLFNAPYQFQRRHNDDNVGDNGYFGRRLAQLSAGCIATARNYVHATIRNHLAHISNAGFDAVAHSAGIVLCHRNTRPWEINCLRLCLHAAGSW